MWLLGVLLLIGATLSSSADAAEKQRPWKEGTVLDFESQRERIYTGTSVSGRVDNNGNYSGQSTPTHVINKELTYAVDAGDRLLMLSQTMHGALARRAFERQAKLVVGDTVRFALEGDTVYVIAADGKERKLRLTRVVLKPKP